MTSNKTFKTIALTLAASASALTLVSAPSAFAVEQRLGGVVGCNASGQKQEGGAVIGALLGAVAGISLLVGGVGILAVMLLSIRERRREIGLRRAVGARRRDILIQFILEAGVVTAAGGLIGVVLQRAIVCPIGNTITIIVF